jgi:murein DD-endopeptidase MepM/ murein hydrolase activator NlpD
MNRRRQGLLRFRKGVLHNCEERRSSNADPLAFFGELRRGTRCASSLPMRRVLTQPTTCCLAVVAIASSALVAWAPRAACSPTRGRDVEKASPPTNPFDEYLRADIPVADGFDFPLGDANGQGQYKDATTGKTHDGYYVATTFGESFSLGLHPGEDWNGKGGRNTDLGLPVYAVAAGRVATAENAGPLWGNIVIIDHLYYENHYKRRIRSVYVHLGMMLVQPGQVVERRDVLGAVGQDPDRLYHAHLHLELRWNADLEPTFWPSAAGKDGAWLRQHYTAPSSFISEHRSLFVPQAERALVLVDHSSYRMRLYRNGELHGEFPASFGQAAGRKRRLGDNRTPKGMYFVIKRHRGAFGGDYADYFGGHWLKINYPNSVDAAWGAGQSLITKAQQQLITDAWRKRNPTLGNTKLGRGIGFHGWIEEWDEEGPRHLSWGCIVMQNQDIKAIYDLVPVGTMVVLF